MLLDGTVQSIQCMVYVLPACVCFIIIYSTYNKHLANELGDDYRTPSPFLEFFNSWAFFYQLFCDCFVLMVVVGLLLLRF